MSDEEKKFCEIVFRTKILKSVLGQFVNADDINGIKTFAVTTLALLPVYQLSYSAQMSLYRAALIRQT